MVNDYNNDEDNCGNSGFCVAGVTSAFTDEESDEILMRF